MNRPLISRIAILACTAILAVPARAAIAFDNLGDPMTFVQGSGWTASGPTSPVGSIEPAFQFTSSASGILWKVTAPMGWVSGTNRGRLKLFNDAGYTV